MFPAVLVQQRDDHLLRVDIVAGDEHVMLAVADALRIHLYIGGDGAERLHHSGLRKRALQLLAARIRVAEKELRRTAGEIERVADIDQHLSGKLVLQRGKGGDDNFSVQRLDDEIRATNSVVVTCDADLRVVFVPNRKRGVAHRIALRVRSTSCVPMTVSCPRSESPRHVRAAHHPRAENRYFHAILKAFSLAGYFATPVLTIPVPAMSAIESKAGQNSDTLPFAIRSTPISLISIS